MHVAPSLVSTVLATPASFASTLPFFPAADIAVAISDGFAGDSGAPSSFLSAAFRGRTRHGNASQHETKGTGWAESRECEKEHTLQSEFEFSSHGRLPCPSPSLRCYTKFHPKNKDFFYTSSSSAGIAQHETAEKSPERHPCPKVYLFASTPSTHLTGRHPSLRSRDRRKGKQVINTRK